MYDSRYISQRGERIAGAEGIRCNGKRVGRKRGEYDRNRMTPTQAKKKVGKNKI